MTMRVRITMRVFVYFNFHKKLWSVKALEGEHKNKVVGHARAVHLNNCQLKVSQAGRDRVIASKQKNVHAGVVGDMCSVLWVNKLRDVLITQNMIDSVPTLQATYNPYKYESFVLCKNEKPVHNAHNAVLNERGLFVTI